MGHSLEIHARRSSFSFHIKDRAGRKQIKLQLLRFVRERYGPRVGLLRLDQGSDASRLRCLLVEKNDQQICKLAPVPREARMRIGPIHIGGLVREDAGQIQLKTGMRRLKRGPPGSGHILHRNTKMPHESRLPPEAVPRTFWHQPPTAVMFVTNFITRIGGELASSG